MLRSFLFLILTVLALVANADVSMQARELKKLRLRINEITANITQLGKEKDSLTAKLSEIEKQYSRLNKEILHLNKQVVENKQHIIKINKDIVKQKNLLRRQQQQLQGQVRAAYALGRQEKLKLILNQQDTALSSRILKYYDYFNQTRIKQIRIISASVSALAMLQEEKQATAKTIQQLLMQYKQDRLKLAESRSARKKLLLAKTKDYEEKSRQLSKLRQNEQKLTQLIEQLQQAVDDFPLDAEAAKPFAQLKGKLHWPVKGRLIKTFGSGRDDRRWDGVLIAAKEGTQVKVVTRGRVVYSDWLRGYGMLLIVDHGKHYMTLYAFNQSLFKSVGDWVERGDVIASVGASGGRKETGLYFAIRKDGKALNPVKWCSSRRRK